MHYTKHSISHYQDGVGQLVRNSMQQAAVKNEVVKFGYDETLLLQIQGLNEELSQVQSAQSKAKAEKVHLFQQKSDLLTEAKKNYMRYLKLSRIALGEDVKAAEALLLNGARSRTYNEMVFEMNVFASNLLANQQWSGALAGYNVSINDLENLQQSLGALNDLTDRCLEAQGEVRRLTVLKKKLLVELQGYVSDYVKIVRIALEKKPRLLVSLGIKAND